MSMKKEYSNLAVCSYVLREGKSIKSLNVSAAREISTWRRTSMRRVISLTIFVDHVN
jgi:hypothetical protein